MCIGLGWDGTLILLIGSNGLTLDPQGRLIITAMADRKKGVRNEEILALIREVVGETAAATGD